MSKPTTETNSSEYQNFHFAEPEPTAEDMAQYGVTTREACLAKMYEDSSFEERKQEAFRQYKIDQGLDELAKSQGEEGQKKQAAAEEEEHREKIADRNRRRNREMEKFRSKIERKANSLLPYIQGAQKWANKPTPPVNATADEMATYVKALRAFEKTESTMVEKAANICRLLNVLFADKASWQRDLMTKDVMAPLTEAISFLKSVLPVSLKGESFDLLRAQVAEYEQDVLYTNDKFCVNPMFLYPRPGQQPPYNYFFVPENSDSPPMWQHRTCKGWDANLGKYVYYGPNGEE